MGDAAGQLAEGFHLLSLSELYRGFALARGHTDILDRGRGHVGDLDEDGLIILREFSGLAIGQTDPSQD